MLNFGGPDDVQADDTSDVESDASHNLSDLLGAMTSSSDC